MKLVLAAAAAASLLALTNSPTQPPKTARGQYLEARTCDVYTGPCFANAEVGQVGREATLAWKIADGEFAGASLAGLNAVAVVEAKETLGDPYHSPLPTRLMLLLDERASPVQRAALRAFVLDRLGPLAGAVVAERVVPISLEIGCCDQKGCAKLDAGGIVRMQTRCLCAKDHVCGNETAYYPPLTIVQEPLSAFTLESAVQDGALGHTWIDRGRRSAVLARFDATARP